jgi:O-antigen/teichoic acid export membrane protein
VSKSIGQKAGNAAMLLFGRKVWSMVMNIGVLAYLARVLPKEDFGVVAISGVLLTFISATVVSGIGEYLIFYNGEDKKKVENAAFWMNIIGAAIVAVLVAISAPLWADLYKDERITNVVYLLALAFIGTMFGVIPRAIFRKNMQYRPIVLMETMSATVNGLGSLILAIYGFGVYSLVIPRVLTSFISSSYLIVVSSLNIRATMSTQHWPQIFKYAKHIVGTRIMGKLANEGDTFIVGLVLGMEALGIYSLAFRIANILNAQILPVITSISLPVLADSRGDKVLMRERFFKMISLITFVIVPIGGAMILFAEPLILLIYSAKWSDAVLPFQIFTVFAIFRAVSSPSSGLYNAAGRPDLALKFTIIFVPLFLIIIYVMGQYGLISLVISVTLARIIGGIINTKLALRLIDTSLLTLYRLIAPVVLMTILISCVIYGLSLFILQYKYTGILLAVLYIFTFYIVSRQIFTRNKYLLSISNGSSPFLKSFIHKLYFIK